MARRLVITNIPNGQLGDVYRDKSFHGSLADGVLLWILGAHSKVASSGHTRKWSLWGTPKRRQLGARPRAATWGTPVSVH